MTTIVIVDLQQAFLTAASTPDLPARIATLLDEHPTAARIATRYVNHPSSPCATLMRWTGATAPQDTALHPAIATRTTTVVDKDTYSVDLAPRIPAGDEVLVAGLDTDVCVQAIATSLFDAGIDVRVAVDLCASSGGPAAHTAGLAVLRRIVGRDRLVNSATLCPAL